MLEQAATVAFCQFILVFLLGIQSQHIRDGQKLYAAITSLLLGIVGWCITGIVSSHYQDGMFSIVFFCFILSGPAGITFSMWLHGYYSKVQNEF